jgi:hypothetical protein
VKAYTFGVNGGTSAPDDPEITPIDGPTVVYFHNGEE